MKGWLLDTNVIASLIAANGAPSVKTWAQAQDEEKLFISVLTLAEYDKGIAKLAADDLNRARYVGARHALEARFEGRILSVTNEIVLRWGAISGRIHRDTGHPPAVIDTLFAATALENNMCFVTRNLKDVIQTGAEVFNPWGTMSADESHKS